MTAPDDLIRPSQAAQLLACHRATVYRYLALGRLRGWRRAGLRLLVSEAEVRALLEPRQPEQSPLPASPAERDRRHHQAVESLRARGWQV